MKASILVVLSVLSSVALCESYDVKLSQVYFDGGYLFFPVKREKMQQRLNEINTHFDNDVKIYLPFPPALQDNSSDEHMVIVGFGNMTAISFNNALTDEEKKYVSTNVAVFGTMIPFLASEERGSAKVAFQETLFSSGDKDIKVNLILPFGVDADKLVRIKNGKKNKIRFERDNLLFEATGEQQGSCEQIYQHVIDDVKEFEHDERHISRTGPDFSICERFPNIDVDFCNVYRDPLYNQVLRETGNNVCNYLKPTSGVQNCENKFHVDAMSQQMRDLLMLDDETNVLEAEIQRGTFDIRLVFPCIQ